MKIMNLVAKIMRFVLNIMDCVFKFMDLAFKIVLLKMMNYQSSSTSATRNYQFSIEEWRQFRIKSSSFSIEKWLDFRLNNGFVFDRKNGLIFA